MNLKEHFVITISRELGSGGHTIGKKLADVLGVRFCDKELIKELSKRFNLTPQSIEKLKSEKKNWLSDLFLRVSAAPSPAGFIETDSVYGKEFNPIVTTEEIFEAEKEILRAMAENESCVIAGRSGFFVLKEFSNKVDIFITASKENRIQRTMQKQNFPRELAAEVLVKVDKARENYIQRFAGVSRYDARNYSLTMNVDGMTEDEAVKVILAYLKQE